MGQARSSRSPRPAPPLSPEREAELRGRVIAGTPEQVADGVREYAAELGSDGLFIFRAHFPGLDPAVQRESFRILVEEVVPLLR
jgi:alkanesulfonate monooxygenase SsuD/methylene tetrahydromethanopterin reductase-like flavin-dependent oxidoreductase (luciferase family)